MNEKISSDNISKMMFFLAIAFTPIAYDVASIRVNDLFLMFSAFFFFAKKQVFDKSFLLSICFCFSILILSIFIGQIEKGDMTLSGFVFFYKYAAVFLVAGLCKEFFSDDLFLDKVVRSYFFVMIVLAIWVYCYIFLVTSGKVSGNFRPSFPFSRDYSESDAHLYSSTLAIMYSVYLFFMRNVLNHGNLYFIFVSIITVGAMVLTGSRGGLLIAGMAIIFFSMISFFRVVIYKKLSFFTLFSAILIIVCGFSIFYFFKEKIDVDFSKLLVLFERAFNFDFVKDESSNLRIEFLQLAINDMMHGFYLFGVGPFASEKVFFDGIISILISHGGLLLLILSFLLLLWVVVRVAKNTDIPSSSKAMLLFLIFIYLFSNIITEYIFVMRNMILAVVGISACFFISSRGSRRNITT